jgi:hypothetical protein
MAGNTLGARNWFAYTSDHGTQFAVFMDEQLAAAGGFTPIAAGPVSLGEFPKRARMRVVNLIADDGQKKVLPVATATGIYAANTSSEVTVSSKSFNTQSRRGERFPYAVAK